MTKRLDLVPELHDLAAVLLVCLASLQCEKHELQVFAWGERLR